MKKDPRKLMMGIVFLSAGLGIMFQQVLIGIGIGIFLGYGAMLYLKKKMPS